MSCPGRFTFTEAANGGILQIIYSAAARKLKLDMLPGKLNMFEEHILGDLLVDFNVFSEFFL